MWSHISLAPEDPIFGLNALFAKDRHPKKVHLGIGAYKDDAGKPVVLKAVRQAEKYLLEENLNKEYPPIEGLPDFIQASMELIFGKENPVLTSGRLVGLQAIGGTGALRLGAEFISQKCSKNVFLPSPTWPNHPQVFNASNLNVQFVPYYNETTHGLDFSGLMEAIKSIPKGSLIVLHACCHNPTGVDPTMAEWQELSQLIKKQQLIPFFDLAYQGFAKNLVDDTAAIRLFVEEGHEMFVANSYSKNFGLYGERVGTLSIISEDPATSPKVKNFFKQFVRATYSLPPIHGARIVTTILNSESLRTLWENELKEMRDRIIAMRHAFVTGLQSEDTPVDFSYIDHQNGMFSFSGLTEAQVIKLREKYGIYTPNNGRINIAGLNASNIRYVVKSVSEVVKNP